MKRFILVMMVMVIVMFTGCFLKGNVKVTDDEGAVIINVETPEVEIKE